MKISLNWLSEYIDIKKYKVGDLVESLTSAGLEVEHIDDKAKHYEHIVIGQIDQLELHPHADRLTLCQVSTTSKDKHQIVCGAANHRQGDKVVLALPGAILPNGLKIKPLEIKDQKSAGMLCSQEELGLESQSDGIMILPKDAPLGCSFAKYIGLDDVLLDVNVTSNRADCLSHLGLSRELAAILNLTYKSPVISLQTEPVKNPLISVIVSQQVYGLCPRYAGRLICDVQVRPSPPWLVQRLKSVGSSSVNNIVDVTNFVMLELGQPLHAFDIRSIQSQQIQVDLARPEELFTTLDGTEITLDGTELMIRDAQKPLALAGIVGGKHSGVYQDTVDVFIESAYFKPEQVRRTSRQLGIETESSYRFSRGVDPNTTLLAMNRACQLIKEVAGGKAQDVFHDIYPKPVTKPCILINTKDISSRLGYNVDSHRCHFLLKNLGCQVHFGKENQASDPMHVGLLKSLGCQSQIKEDEADLLKVRPPSYRQDLSIKEDLIEEVARLEGYHKIPSGQVLTNSYIQPHAKTYLLQKQLNDLIRRQGYQQTISLAFCHLEAQKQLLGSLQSLRKAGLDISDNPVSLTNPISQELNVMRQSLFPSLLNVLIHNCHHKITYGRIYEIGYAFQGSSNKEKKTEISLEEKWHLGIMSWGHLTSVWQKTHPSLVLEVKKHISNLLKSLSINSYQWKKADPAPDFLHPGQTAFLFCEGKNVGYIGTLHPQMLKQHKVFQHGMSQHGVSLEAVCAELNLDRLLASHPRSVKSKDFSRFPSVERDISILVDKNIEIGVIMQVIWQSGGKNLQSVTLFDIYQDPKTPDKKSLAFRLLYQKKEATLAEDDIHQIQVKIIKSLEQKFDAKLRSFH